MRLPVSNNGKNFISLGRLKPTEFHGWQDTGKGCKHAIEEVTARFFRFVFDTCDTPEPSENREGTKMRNRNRLSASERRDKLFLNLGRVANLAEVKINGNDLGVLWKPPFIVEVSDYVKPGRNVLSVAVTNTWHNRLVGDAALPEDKRITNMASIKEAGSGPVADIKVSGLMVLLN